MHVYRILIKISQYKLCLVYLLMVCFTILCLYAEKSEREREMSLNFFHDKDQLLNYFLNKIFQASKRNYWGWGVERSRPKTSFFSTNRSRSVASAKEISFLSLSAQDRNQLSLMIQSPALSPDRSPALYTNTFGVAFPDQALAFLTGCSPPGSERAAQAETKEPHQESK